MQFLNIKNAPTIPGLKYTDAKAEKAATKHTFVFVSDNPTVKTPGERVLSGVKTAWAKADDDAKNGAELVYIPYFKDGDDEKINLRIAGDVNAVRKVLNTMYTPETTNAIIANYGITRANYQAKGIKEIFDAEIAAYELVKVRKPKSEDIEVDPRALMLLANDYMEYAESHYAPDPNAENRKKGAKATKSAKKGSGLNSFQKRVKEIFEINRKADAAIAAGNNDAVNDVRILNVSGLTEKGTGYKTVKPTDKYTFIVDGDLPFASDNIAAYKRAISQTYTEAGLTTYANEIQEMNNLLSGSARTNVAARASPPAVAAVNTNMNQNQVGNMAPRSTLRRASPTNVNGMPNLRSSRSPTNASGVRGIGNL